MMFLICALILGHITTFCVSVYLHRSIAHKAVKLHPSIEIICRMWLWLTTGIITRQWVAIHRKHHRFTDEPADPHSPMQKGFFTVLFGGVFLYLTEGKDVKTMMSYGRGSPTDSMEKFFMKHNYLGLLISFSVCVLFGWFAVGLWFVNFLWIPFWAAGVVNGVGHTIGYRNFDTPDASRNFSPLGIFLLGEELHNNHHAAPSSAKFSSKWFEFDIGWVWINLLCSVNLASLSKET